ncbi:hypothetical protein [Nostoc sp.]|uniref:hypothetical protein n=1 Tax=Nostoc sp. TaxID=1180 RepID=UPI002FF8370A
MADLCILVPRKSATAKVKVLTTATCVGTVTSLGKAIGCILLQIEQLDRTTQHLTTISDEDHD